MSPETVAMDGKKWMDLRNTHEVESSVFDLWLHLEVGGGKQSLKWLHFKTLKSQSWMSYKVCGLWYEKKVQSIGNISTKQWRKIKLLPISIGHDIKAARKHQQMVYTWPLLCILNKACQKIEISLEKNKA